MDETNKDSSDPDLLQEYLRNLKADGRPHSIRAERKAFGAMRSDIEREKDAHIRQFMEDTVMYCCRGGTMLLSYAYEFCWRDWIKEQKAIKKNTRPMALYIALESILASQSDSSGYIKTQSYNRYSLVIPGHHSGTQSGRSVDRNISPSLFLRSYYKFGVHKFHVGYGIKEIIEHLEERYGLDFERLEQARQDDEET